MPLRFCVLKLSAGSVRLLRAGSLRDAAVGNVAFKYCTLGPEARLYLDSVRDCAD
jgi:hypothetical protein